MTLDLTSFLIGALAGLVTGAAATFLAVILYGE